MSFFCFYQLGRFKKALKLKNKAQKPIHFRGRVSLKLDPKGRIAMPLHFRQCQEKFVLTTNRYSDLTCLDAYCAKDWYELESKFYLEEEPQSLQRQYYFSGAVEVESDTQHRLLINPHLKSYALLKEKILIVGLVENLKYGMKKMEPFLRKIFKNFNSNLSLVALKDETQNKKSVGGKNEL